MAVKRRAVFLDRDGTINVEKEYLFRIEDCRIIPGAAEAVKLLNRAGFLVVVVTNQSGIGRGYYDESQLEELHCHMGQEMAAAGARIDGWYFCPHHPEHGIGNYRAECACRKPLPGMLLKAAEDLNIDLASSFMVGDKLADVEAGLAAGCRPLLVRTGYGEKEEALLPAHILAFDDLFAATLAIVDQLAGIDLKP